jgi:uncharacterized protein DUF6755
MDLRHGTPLYTAAAAFIGLLVVIQLWLLSAALDALLGGVRGVLWAAAIAQAAIAAVNGALLLAVLGFDRRLRGTRRRD